MYFYPYLLILSLFFTSAEKIQAQQQAQLIVLGNVQDGGSPHIGCKKDCCSELFNYPDPTRQVASLGLVDFVENKRYLFDATPNLTTQVKMLKNSGPFTDKEVPDGIFLTHAHIGHYTGLMYLGKEANDAKEVPVYAMPKMGEFLHKNGPWGQLISRKNISVIPIKNNQTISLGKNISVIPIQVPHRDEYSETVGFKIIGPHKKALFIPDIDKWEKWDHDIIKELAEVDFLLVDGTFYSGAEMNYRDISQIPHPMITETMKKFENLPSTEKNKVYFIHLNHSNPALLPDSEASKAISEKGFHVARFGDRLQL